MNEEEVIIDLNKYKNQPLEEGMYDEFGSVIKMWLRTYLGANPLNFHPKFRVRGNRGDIASLMKTLGSQSKYLKTAVSLGLDDPRTFLNKSKFRTAMKNFERKTGIRWPVR